MFGLGGQELLLLGCLAVVPVVIAVIVIAANRARARGNGPPDEDDP